jgi:hypothetical protein
MDILARAFLAVVLCAALGRELPVKAIQQPVSPSAPDVTTLGPQVGKKVPDFRLQDQHGKSQSIASLMGDKGLVLVFYRSADW